MPYSLMSIILQYQAETFDNTIAKFYIEDYYKVDGQTQLHKFMYNPVLLDQLLDDYWSQDKMFLLAVLIKQEIATTATTKAHNFKVENNLKQDMARLL